MSSWIKIKGTQTGSFQLGLTGPVLNNNSGNLQLRNSANTANADISLGNVSADTATVVNLNTTGVVNAVGATFVGNLTVAGVGTLSALNVSGPTFVGNLTVAGPGTLSELNVSGTTYLNDVGNVTIMGGSTGQVLTTDGNGQLSWSTVSSGNVSGNVGGNGGGNTSYATTAGTVTNAAQPNITSVGDLTGLTVRGIVDLANAANVKIYGGSAGQVLTSDGNGSLSWSTISSGANSNISGNGNISSNSSSSYGDSNVTQLLTSGNFVGNLILGSNVGTSGSIELRGINSRLTASYIEANTEFSTRSVSSASMGINTDLDLKSSANLNIQGYTGIGNGFTNVISVISDYPNFASAPRVAIVGNVVIAGDITATNLGNIAAINLDGNASNILYGNGVFAAAPSASGNVSNVSNVSSGSTDYWRATSKSFAYSSSSQVEVMSLPSNATVDKVTVIVDTAFNGNAPSATVGFSTGTGVEFVNTGDVDLKTADRYDLPCQLAPSANTANIVINYTASGSGAGSARVIVTYAVAS